MRNVIYVIVPALSLLNMGVEAATISKALTSKHSSDGLQARKIVHDRQFHNADFGLDSGHVARNQVDDVVDKDGKVSTTNGNGTSFGFAANKKFVETISGETNSATPDATATPGATTTPSAIKVEAPDANVGDVTSNIPSNSGSKAVPTNMSNASPDSGDSFTSSDSGVVTGVVLDSSSSDTNVTSSGILKDGSDTGEAGSTPDFFFGSGNGVPTSLFQLLTSQFIKSPSTELLSGASVNKNSSGSPAIADDNVEVSEPAKKEDSRPGTDDVDSAGAINAAEHVPTSESLKGRMVFPQGFERRMVKVPRADPAANSVHLDLQRQPVVKQSLPAITNSPSTKRSDFFKREDYSSDQSSIADLD